MDYFDLHSVKILWNPISVCTYMSKVVKKKFLSVMFGEAFMVSCLCLYCNYMSKVVKKKFLSVMLG